MKAPDARPVCWLVVWWAAALGAALLPASAATAGSLRVQPAESLSTLREKLASDASITEVVFEAGTYSGSLYISGSKDTDFAKFPLLIRAADGAKVVFDGSAPVERFRAEEKLTGVFWMEYTDRGGECPKLWEPRTRMRYRLVADRQAVARFPATYTVEGKRLLFHTSDGQTPGRGELLMSASDSGIFVNRPHVTIRGIEFENYLAREKWSTAIDLRVDHITVEDCSSRNASLGFIITGNNNAVRRCTAEDVGGGVYVGGENATVEGCRLYKRRDTFLVPMYAQDDTGIQFYHPARGGMIRENLCVGFGMGVFIKALAAPYQVEHNTLVGLGQGLGFGATNWHAGERFRFNIISDCDRQVEIYSNDARPGDVDHNCYWSRSRRDVKPIGRNDMVADPKFVWPEWKDYRLANDSPCLKLADASGPCGAFPAVGNATIDLGPPRQWHVSETGRDGRDGSAEQPVRTIQSAVDRAKPGDTIIVHPGLYPDPVRITRGGSTDRPIVIRAAKPWQARLDSGRAASVMIQIAQAPYVEIHDLEIRWYGSVGIGITQSPNVTVAGCRIWNGHWHGAWPTGIAVRLEQSPGFVGQQNVLFRQEHGFWLYNSPNATLTHNTCAANLYSAAAFLYSCEKSVCRNNSFAFQGNDVIVIEENLGQENKLATFDCDYNNYGTTVRPQPAGTTFDSIAPRKNETYLNQGSKAIVNYTEYKGEMRRFVKLEEWRAFSGLDRHTIFADPLYVDTAARDFDLDPKSPNRNAGADGVKIGAVGTAQGIQAREPSLVPATAAAPSSPRPRAWQRWDHALTSARNYDNPYAVVTLRVTYTGPQGRTLRAYGFWDGENTFRIRCAFPAPGIWRWETECSDAANAGLHRQRGTVDVGAYQGANPLYRGGFLKVSDNRRFLVHSDGTPFLWVGDTAWAVPQRASDEEWEAYIADRIAKHFTLIQVAPAPKWAGASDRRGERPFADKTCARWNPAYWQSFERKVHRANEQGLVVLLVGLMEPVERYPKSNEACLFARNIVARLFGNFVIFSPSFDSEVLPLADEVGRAAREATAAHLITQHPGTPWNQPLPTFSLKYYDQPYLDIAAVQTGHNAGNLEWCAHHAIEWNLHLYRHEPHKPVINLEAMYDAQGEKDWRAVDARSLAWRSWLSGAMGYTCGAGDLPPKVPQGSGAVWKWVTDPEKYDYWKKALQWDSAFQMQHLHDFLAAIEWWRLEPAHDLVRNQPDDVKRRMVLAKSAAGDLAVAYLPDNDAIEIDVSEFPAALEARWFDPVRGRYTAAAGRIEDKGIRRLTPPAKGDWVLLLQRAGR